MSDCFHSSKTLPLAERMLFTMSMMLGIGYSLYRHHPLCGERPCGSGAALEDMGKPIGVADYQLIVPKKELEEVLTNEIKKFGEEILKN